MKNTEKLLNENPLEIAAEIAVEDDVDDVWKRLPKETKKTLRANNPSKVLRKFAKHSPLDPVNIVKKVPHIDKRTSTGKGLVRYGAKQIDDFSTWVKSTVQKEENLNELSKNAYRFYKAHALRNKKNLEKVASGLRRAASIDSADIDRKWLMNKRVGVNRLLKNRESGIARADKKLHEINYMTLVSYLRKSGEKGARDLEVLKYTTALKKMELKNPAADSETIDGLSAATLYGRNQVKKHITGGAVATKRLGGAKPGENKHFYNAENQAKLDAKISKIVGEEKLNELQTNTYRSYLAKALIRKKELQGSLRINPRMKTKNFEKRQLHKINRRSIGMKRAEKKIYGEETLNEVSDKLLHRYLWAATRQKNAGEHWLSTLPDLEAAAKDDWVKTIIRRDKGIRLARAKLDRKDLEQYHPLDIKKYMDNLLKKGPRNESVELSELSKEILARYLKLAIHDQDHYARKVAHRQALKSKFNPADIHPNFNKTLKKDRRKLNNRSWGISTAWSKMHHNRKPGETKKKIAKFPLAESSKWKMFWTASKRINWFNGEAKDKSIELFRRHYSGHYVPETEANEFFRKFDVRSANVELAIRRLAGKKPGETWAQKSVRGHLPKMRPNLGTKLNKLIDQGKEYDPSNPLGEEALSELSNSLIKRYSNKASKEWYGAYRTRRALVKAMGDNGKRSFPELEKTVAKRNTGLAMADIKMKRNQRYHELALRSDKHDSEKYNLPKLDEETQLNEISKATINSYLKKIYKKHGKLAVDAYMDPSDAVARKKYDLAQLSSARAMLRLFGTKPKRGQAKEYLGIKEETQNLNEISAKLAARYLVRRGAIFVDSRKGQVTFPSQQMQYYEKNAAQARYRAQKRGHATNYEKDMIRGHNKIAKATNWAMSKLYNKGLDKSQGTAADANQYVRDALLSAEKDRLDHALLVGKTPTIKMQVKKFAPKITSPDDNVIARRDQFKGPPKKRVRTAEHLPIDHIVDGVPPSHHLISNEGRVMVSGDLKKVMRARKGDMKVILSNHPKVRPGVKLSKDELKVLDKISKKHERGGISEEAVSGFMARHDKGIAAGVAVGLAALKFHRDNKAHKKALAVRRRKETIRQKQNHDHIHAALAVAALANHHPNHDHHENDFRGKGGGFDGGGASHSW
jgi:hypothetical protein